MSLGRWRAKQGVLFVEAEKLSGPGHPFYDRLNRILKDAGFDEWAETLACPFYRHREGREGIAPGVYCRMLFLGWFEGISSERQIAWRCADSRSLAAYLGYGPEERTPDHSTLAGIRKRLPESFHEHVFDWVLGLLRREGLVVGRKLAVDSTELKANAALKKIKYKQTGQYYRQWVRSLAQVEGVEIEDENDLNRFDRTRKDKKLPNEEWESSTDKDARIARMKDGTTRLAYKAEHAVDLDSGAIVSAELHPADRMDADTLVPTVNTAGTKLEALGIETVGSAWVADRGYYSKDNVSVLSLAGLTSVVAERKKLTHGGPLGLLTFLNHLHTVSWLGKCLHKLRTMLAERSFAHVCETGGLRRLYLRGRENAQKRYSLHTAAFNLGLLMRKKYGAGTPRAMAEAGNDPENGPGTPRGLLWVIRAAVRRFRWPGKETGHSAPALGAVLLAA